MAIVYSHKKKGTDIVFYIGIGIDEKRAFSKRNRNKYWNNVVNKYDYDVTILFENITYEKANEKEIELILKYGRIDLKTGTLVNLTIGGDGVKGYKYTDLVKKKMSILKKGITSPMLGKKHSEETKYKISKAKTGKKLSESHKDKIGLSNLCKNLSESHKNILIQSNSNRIISEETRKKMSESKLKMSNETKKKISLNNKKSKIVINKESGIFYNSIKEAAFYECISYNKLKNISRKNGYNNNTNLLII